MVLSENSIHINFHNYKLSSTTFPEIGFFTTSIDVLVTTMKLLKTVGVFVGVGLVELEVIMMVLGDMRMQLPMMGWDISIRKETFFSKGRQFYPPRNS